ncbi:MAG TPA: hypothetical protein VGV40_00600 [Solirubrobacteraceae bacterium]|nr:hypothetical protein [Solirubrobacteraceae bacterium]
MRRVLAALALGGALGSGACAGGGMETADRGLSAGGPPAQAPAPPTMTRQEAARRAEAACARTARLIDELMDGSDLKDPAGQSEFGERRLVLERDLANALADLDPGSNQLPMFERFAAAVDLRADLREQILDEVAAGDRQAAEEAASQLAIAVEDGQRAASEYGLDTCASLGVD